MERPFHLRWEFHAKESSGRPPLNKVQRVVSCPGDSLVRSFGNQPVVAADVGHCHLRGVEGLWELRFFFRDLHELISRDPILAKSYRELQGWLVRRFSVLFERVIAQGKMRPPEPRSDLERVATNASMLWTSWINFVTTSRRSEIRPGDIVEGALQGFLSIAPYLEKGFAREVRRFIARQSGATKR